MIPDWTNRVQRSLLIAVSAPSGAGKTTLCHRVRAQHPNVRYSISCTTRAPRGQERDGIDYWFIAEPEFLRRVEQGEFLEFARVHGAWYGTLRKTVEGALRAGHDLIMDIDVQGAAQIREYVRNRPGDDLLRRGFLDIFIAPPSLDALEERLNGRRQDEPEVIRRRLQQAEAELSQWPEYAYLVVNDDLETAVHALCSILTAEHHRIERFDLPVSSSPCGA